VGCGDQSRGHGVASARTDDIHATSVEQTSVLLAVIHSVARCQYLLAKEQRICSGFSRSCRIVAVQTILFALSSEH